MRKRRRPQIQAVLPPRSRRPSLRQPCSGWRQTASSTLMTTPHRARAVIRSPQPDRRYPFVNETGILPCADRLPMFDPAREHEVFSGAAAVGAMQQGCHERHQSAQTGPVDRSFAGSPWLGSECQPARSKPISSSPDHNHVACRRWQDQTARGLVSALPCRERNGSPKSASE